MSAADKTKLDSIGATPNVAPGIGLTSTTNNSTLTLKAKLRSETALSTGSQNANISGTKVYAVQADKDGYLAVSVPWTDNNTTYTNATQNVAGLMSPEDKRKLDSLYEADGTGTVKSISAGIGLTTANGSAITQSGTIKAKLKDEVLLSVGAQTNTGVANRTYAVVGDKDGYLSVVVPWTDSNVTYDALTTSLISAGTDTTDRLISAKVLKDALDNYIAATDAMVFKGTLGTGGTITSLPATHNAGWTYRVITAGDYAGQHAEIGDLVICITDGTSANNGHWTVAQTNIDGAVVGPASATSNNVALFDGTTGKLIRDSGFTLGTSVPANAKFTDTDTKVTSAENHYTPAADNNSELTANLSGSAGGYSLNAEYTVLTGLKIQRDAKGHVTGVSYTAQKIKDTDTTYTSKAASNGGTDVSLVTTGEKYLWNSKTSNTGTVTSINTGIGLTGGNITSSGTIKVKLASETALSADSAQATETSGRIYSVVTDKSGNLAVVVPWTDTNTQTVTGVKGSAETNYRTGNVNITAANIGAATTDHVHGNITNDGKLDNVEVAVATGDALLIADNSNNGKIERSSITIGTGTTKFLREDGTWEVPSDTHWTTRLHAGTGTAANATAENGNVKLTVSDNNTARTSVTIQGSGTTTVSSNNSGVITINTADQYTGTVTSIATGVGLTGGSITSSGTIKTKLKSETALTVAAGNPTNETNRTYPVAVDSAGNLAVNIPWTDNNTTYNEATQSTSGLMSANDKTKLDGIAAGAQPGTVTKVSTGVGLTGGDITTNGTIKANLKSETKLANSSTNATEDSNRIYSIVPDKDGYLSVVVPWTDNNTTYGTLTASDINTGTDTTPKVISAKVFKDALAAYIAATDAMVFKGLASSNSSLPTTHNAGWTYRVSAAGEFAGQQAEIGDLIICITDGTTANNAHWMVVQANIDGAVTGPSSSTDAHVAVFNGTSGKIIKDSGFTIGKSVPSDAKFTDTTYVFENTYNASTNKAATVASITSRIEQLDANITGIPSASKTLTVFTEQDGIVNATFADISIGKSQIVDFPTSMTPTSHTHGNVSNIGAIINNSIAAATGDALLLADASDSNKLIKSSIQFDASITNKYLTQAGTWDAPTAYSHPTHTAHSEGLYKITVDNLGHVTAVSAVTQSDLLALGVSQAQIVIWADVASA